MLGLAGACSRRDARRAQREHDPAVRKPAQRGLQRGRGEGDDEIGILALDGRRQRVERARVELRVAQAHGAVFSVGVAEAGPFFLEPRVAVLEVGRAVVGQEGDRGDARALRGVQRLECIQHRLRTLRTVLVSRREGDERCGDLPARGESIGLQGDALRHEVVDRQHARIDAPEQRLRVEPRRHAAGVPVGADVDVRTVGRKLGKVGDDAHMALAGAADERPGGRIDDGVGWQPQRVDAAR